MDLRDRLERLNRRPQPAPSEPPLERDAAGPPLESLVPGRWISFGSTHCFLAEQRYDIEHQHGQHRLAEALQVSPQRWGHYIGGGAEALPLDQALFIDTETTGLMRGPITVAFLVGLGRFEGDTFVVRQFFMPEYAAEEALLELLNDELRGPAGLVSFNGRAFDWPLLQARYLMARRAVPRRAEPHLDLLLLARRLWRRRLDSCALGHLEGQVLGVERDSQDVPGYLIPQLYHDYVDYGRTRPMADVFYHNRVDIISLVTLAARIGQLLDTAELPAEDQHRDDLALGRLHERNGEHAPALEAYTRAIDTGNEIERPEARRLLALLLKRLGRSEEAAALWWQAAGEGELYAFEELAKYYEHERREYARAHEITEAGLNCLAEANQLDVYTISQSRQAFRHRLARLERRLERHEKSTYESTTGEH